MPVSHKLQALKAHYKDYLRKLAAHQRDGDAATGGVVGLATQPTVAIQRAHYIIADELAQQRIRVEASFDHAFAKVRTLATSAIDVAELKAAYRDSKQRAKERLRRAIDAKLEYLTGAAARASASTPDMSASTTPSVGTEAAAPQSAATDLQQHQTPSVAATSSLQELEQLFGSDGLLRVSFRVLLYCSLYRRRQLQARAPPAATAAATRPLAPCLYPCVLPTTQQLHIRIRLPCPTIPFPTSSFPVMPHHSPFHANPHALPALTHTVLAPSPPLPAFSRHQRSVLYLVGSASRAYMTSLNTTTVHGGLDTLAAALRSRQPGQALVTVCNHVAALDDPLLVAALLPEGALEQPEQLRWVKAREQRGADLQPGVRMG